MKESSANRTQIVGMAIDKKRQTVHAMHKDNNLMSSTKLLSKGIIKDQAPQTKRYFGYSHFTESNNIRYLKYNFINSVKNFRDRKRSHLVKLNQYDDKVSTKHQPSQGAKKAKRVVQK